MPTLILDPPPAELEALIERRRRLGLDTHDEVWEGELHMAPSPLRRHALLQAEILVILHGLGRAAGLDVGAEVNIGAAGDFRVPDAALLTPGPDALYMDTAALVVEVLSPGDETRKKLPFYAARGVGELLIVDPVQRSVEWLALVDGEYRPVARSALIELGPAELEQRIDWPPVG